MNLRNIILNIIMIASMLLMLSSCGRSDDCLEADDFGFAKVTISSRYDRADMFGTQENEIAPWKDNGLILDGNPLYIEVKNWYYKVDANAPGTVSAWCPWFGDKDHDSTLTKFCERLPPCNFKGAEFCYDASGNPTNNACVSQAMCTNTRDAQITNAPCIMTKGVGLYALLTSPGYNVNLSMNTIANPDGLSMHMGEPHAGYIIPSMADDGTSTNAGGILYDYDGNHTLNSNRLGYVNGNLYFKILDHFYDDNNGQYRVFIKSGVVNGGWDPISWCIELVKTALFGVNPTASVETNYGDGGSGIVPQIYSNIVANSSFVNTIRATLTLYVVFTAIGFLLGSIELTQKELLSRVFKITIIVALISPASWDFFNKNLFIWFYEGTGFVINILTQVAASGPGSTNPLSFFFSEEIFIKLSSLLFSTATGWIYITIYLIMLVFLVIIYFDAAVIYMTALIMMGVLISIGPIFIALYLFEQTKSFFDNWLKQLMGYAVQMILVYAGILFMTMIIRNQVYNTLGFPTCAIEFPNIGGITIFKWYFPKIQSWDDNPPQALIPIPKDHFQSPQDSTLSFGFAQSNLTDSDFCKTNPTLCNNIDNPQVGAFCTAYECLGSRYLDLPFLDPNDDYESTLINQMRGGYIGDFSGLAIIVICIYLMDHFNKSTVSMAKFLSNNIGNQGDSTKAAGAASIAFKSAAMQPIHYADKRLGVSAAVKSARAGVHDFFAQAKYKMIDKPWANYKIGSLKEDALNDSRWTKSMRKGAENATGMSFKEATEFNNQYQKGHYASDLNSKINTATSRSDAQTAVATKQILGRLSKGKAENFKDIAAQELFKDNPQYKSLKGKMDYSKLSATDQKIINDLAKSAKPMLDLKQKQEAYQDAYAKSYINMSNEGRGFLQKRSSALRWGQDVKNRMADSELKEEQARMLQGEKYLSKYDSMKRLISGGLLGSERSQILYNDSHMRTMDEQLSSTMSEKAHHQATTDLNRAIVKEGKDIQRPDFKSAQYQGLIDNHLASSVKQELKFADPEGKKALLMGDTYMKTKMTDRSMKEMIDQMREKEQKILNSDSYLKDTSKYAGNHEALEKLENRATLIHNTVQKEIDRVNEIRASRGMDAYHGRSSDGREDQSSARQAGTTSRSTTSQGGSSRNVADQSQGHDYTEHVSSSQGPSRTPNAHSHEEHSITDSESTSARSAELPKQNPRDVIEHETSTSGRATSSKDELRQILDAPTKTPSESSSPYNKPTGPNTRSHGAPSGVDRSSDGSSAVRTPNEPSSAYKDTGSRDTSHQTSETQGASARTPSKSSISDESQYSRSAAPPKQNPRDASETGTAQASNRGGSAPSRNEPEHEQRSSRPADPHDAATSTRAPSTEHEAQYTDQSRSSRDVKPEQGYSDTGGTSHPTPTSYDKPQQSHETENLKASAEHKQEVTSEDHPTSSKPDTSKSMDTTEKPLGSTNILHADDIMNVKVQTGIEGQNLLSIDVNQPSTQDNATTDDKYALKPTKDDKHTPAPTAKAPPSRGGSDKSESSNSNSDEPTSEESSDPTTTKGKR